MGWNLLRATSWLVGFGLVNRRPPEVAGPGSDAENRPCGIASGSDVEVCSSGCFANSRRPWDERAALAHRCKSGGRTDGQGVGKQGRAQTVRDLYREGSQFSRIGRMRQEVGESRGRGSAVAAGGGPGTRAGCHMGYGSAARCDCGRRGSVGHGWEREVSLWAARGCCEPVFGEALGIFRRLAGSVLDRA